MTSSKTWIDELSTFLQPEQISTSYAVLEQHSRGESFDEGKMPDVVLFPESTTDVQAIIRFAYEKGIPVTPVAVNSSLEGHTVPLKAGISLDMMRMNRVKSFHPEDLLIVVEPAITYPEVNDYTRRSGLFFPIDPGAHASIGGMVSTNASGTMAVRYGVTSDYVIALEVVTPTGELIRTGSQARKSSSGYNLKRLFCGAEGTLGIITEVSLKLVGLPESASAARVPFKTIKDATEFVTSLIQAGLPIARCELVDAYSIRAANAYNGTNYPEEVTIFLEFHGNEQGVIADAHLAKDIAQHHGAGAFESSTDPRERQMIWQARHTVYYACLALNPGLSSISTDVTVPISKMPEVVELSLSAYRRAGFKASIVGHVGDGNFHLLIFYDASDKAAVERLEQAGHEMIVAALNSGGTCTGEHGVGIRKLKYMEEEHGLSLHYMKLIKQAFDPKGIMNPGKKLPE
ncbi:MAG: FAD-binding protein [Trueperaceae bacterium]|nr:FAD-binding protein [Trueperaceae bacterium]